MSISGKILRGTAWTSGANLLASVGTFLGNLAIIRLLGLELVGQLGLIESWVSLITMFSLFGLNLAATKYVSHYLETDKQKIGNVAAAVLIMGSGFSILVCLFIFALFLFTSPDFLKPDSVWVNIRTTLTSQTLIIIIIGLIVTMTLRHLVVGLVHGVQAFHVFVTVNMVIGLISFPLSYGLAVLYGLNGALGVRLVLLTIELVLLGIVFGQTLSRLEIKLSLKDFPYHMRQLLHFGTPTFLGQLVGNPAQTFMMSFLAVQPNGLAQVGLLTTGKRLASLTAFLPGAMATTVMPILSTEWGRGEKAKFREGILSALRMLWFSSLPVVIFFLAAVVTLLGMLYGEEYVAAASIAAIFLIVQLLGAINETGDRILAAANRMWLSTSNNLVWLVLFLVLALGLIPTMQALGYALAFLISFALYVMVQTGWLHRLFQLQLQPLLPLLISSIILIVLAILNAYFISGVWQLLTAAFLASSTVLVIWHYFLYPEERNAVGVLMRRVHWVNMAWLQWQARK